MLIPLLATAGEFTRTLTPEELRITGLSKLSPEELAALNIRIERYKDGGAPGPGVEKAAPAPEAPKAAAEKPADNKIVPDWVGALITLKRAEDSMAKPQVLESRIVGDFAGWKGKTTFKLENGQLWAQANDDAFVYTPPVKAPKVKIFPATFGTFWMQIEGVGVRCRVRPVRLE